MEDLIEIQQLWLQARPVQDISANDVIRAAKKQTRLTAWKTVAVILMLAVTLIVMAYALFSYEFRLMTTKVGLALVVNGVIAGIVMNMPLLWSLMQPDDKSDNRVFLAAMERIEQKETYIFNTGIGLYFAILGIGIGLYMYEFSNGAVAIIRNYGLTAAWFLFVWFYLRPKTIRKRQAKTRDAIERVRRIVEQLDAA